MAERGMGPTALAGEDALIGSASRRWPTDTGGNQRASLGELGVPFAEIQRPIKRKASGYCGKQAAIKRTQLTKFSPVALSRGLGQTSSRANPASA